MVKYLGGKLFRQVCFRVTKIVVQRALPKSVSYLPKSLSAFCIIQLKHRKFASAMLRS